MADAQQIQRPRARAPAQAPAARPAGPTATAQQPAPATPALPRYQQAGGGAPAPSDGLPSYLQARLPISRPDDPAEREADQTARAVAQQMQPGPVAPRQPAGAPTRLLRQARPETARADARADAETDTGPPAAPDDVAQRLETRHAGAAGHPLPRALRRQLAPRLGDDLADVRIHTDDEAAQLCRRVGALAFTVGHDVYFAHGAWDPASPSGIELLVHELTHVIQQRDSSQRTLARRIDPQPGVAPTPEPDATARTKLAAVQVLPLPRSKRRHLPVYQAWQQGGRLIRPAGYDREDPRQVSVWNQHISITPEALNQRLTARGIPTATHDTDMVKLKIGNRNRERSRRDWLRDLRAPDFDRRGRNASFQVDHIVELQVSGEHGEGVGNSPENMELFDAASNTSSGRTMMSGIRAQVREYREALPAAVRPAGNSAWLRNHSIAFDRVAISNEGAAENNSTWWTRQEILAVEPLATASVVPPTNIEGTSGHLVLASGAGGIAIGRYPRVPDGARNLAFAPDSPDAKRLAGMTIATMSLAEGIGAPQEAGANVGTLAFRWDLPADFHATGGLQTIDLQSTGRLHSANPGPMPKLEGDFAPLSPFSFDTVSIRDGELYAVGTILPSLPLLSRARLEAVLRGNDVQVRAVLPVDQLQLSLPGFSLDGGSLVLSYSARDGFGAAGMLGFSVANLGTGELEVGVNEAHGFGAEGRFEFDPGLFDRAGVRVWYRDGQFGGAGEIGIDTPDKVRGIRAANLAIAWEAGRFSAVGSVAPSIPGVQEAGLTVSYAEDEGLSIGGHLQLAANPAIRSGRIEVTVRKPEDRWLVHASGTAVPAIPGLASELTVTYDDGAFDARFQGAFERGMLSGTVEAGATNSTVDAQGQPTGDAQPGAPLVVYGGGSATLRLAPWLQGTAGVRFAPNGEVTVQGEIGLPSSLSLFDRRQVQRQLFGVSVQVPIVPGIVAEVGGNLTAVAGIGPGMLEQLRIGITYNPSHEEDTHITGDAHLRVPADAGLRLGARAGIGLGIPGASATGGLELGGMAGIAGAAEASVHIDWRPGTGLAIDAEAALHAEPVFRFDVSGYVSVSALGFSVYDERWQLAAMEVGSGLALGVRFPVHYQQGQPFDVNINDVQFDLPPIDTMGLVRQVLAQVA